LSRYEYPLTYIPCRRLSTLALTRREALLLQLRQWSLLLPAVGAAGFLDGPVPPPLLGLGLDPQPSALEREQDRGQKYHAIGDLNENARAYLERFDTRKQYVAVYLSLMIRFSVLFISYIYFNVFCIVNTNTCFGD
jgi:hypothetical protein